MTSNSNPKPTKTTLYLSIGIVIFLASMLCYHLYVNRQQSNRLQNMAITTGVAHDFFPSRHSIEMEYTYWVNGKQYHDLGKASRMFDFPVLPFNGKRFPVVFDSTDPGNGEMLINPERFAHYGLEFPDSLDYVLPYFN